MGNIILHDKEFRPFIEATKIDQVITRMAEQMNRELADTQPLFLSILNGSFMFTSDLIKQIVIPGTQISFVKVASYSGTCSTGAIQELIGLIEDIQYRTVVILVLGLFIALLFPEIFLDFCFRLFLAGEV